MAVFPSNTFIEDTLGLITDDTPYLALYTSNPTGADTGTEVSGGSYARKAITFGSVSSGSVSNTVAISFTGMPTATITHYGVRNAATGGDLKVYGAINSTIVSVSGDEILFSVGSIQIGQSGS